MKKLLLALFPCCSLIAGTYLTLDITITNNVLGTATNVAGPWHYQEWTNDYSNIVGYDFTSNGMGFFKGATIRRVVMTNSEPAMLPDINFSDFLGTTAPPIPSALRIIK